MLRKRDKRDCKMFARYGVQILFDVDVIYNRFLFTLQLYNQFFSPVSNLFELDIETPPQYSRPFTYTPRQGMLSFCCLSSFRLLFALTDRLACGLLIFFLYQLGNVGLLY